MVESGLFTFFSRLAQAYVWTKTKGFYQSCTLRFLIDITKVYKIRFLFDLSEEMSCHCLKLHDLYLL